MLLGLFNWFTDHYKAHLKDIIFQMGLLSLIMSPIYSILMGCE